MSEYILILFSISCIYHNWLLPIICTDKHAKHRNFILCDSKPNWQEQVENTIALYFDR